MKEINGYRLKLTCECCPEQYDVFKDGEQVGYLRLRHGYFTADYHCDEETTILQCQPNGDGTFEPQERDIYLNAAISALDTYIKQLK